MMSCSCKVIGDSIAFSLGLATTLALLGVGASFAGKAYGQVGQGLPVAASGIAVIMGLNLLEVIKQFLFQITLYILKVTNLSSENPCYNFLTSFVVIIPSQLARFFTEFSNHFFIIFFGKYPSLTLTKDNALKEFIKKDTLHFTSWFLWD